MAPPLAFSAGIYLVAAAAFLMTARTVARRQVDARSALANGAWTVWWLGLGAYMSVQGGMALYATLSPGHLEPFFWVRFLNIPLVTGASAALTVYFVFLFTGRSDVAVPIVGFYLLVALLFVGVVASRPTADATLHTWLPELRYTVPLQSPLYTVVLFAVGVPPIAGSIAYLTLLGRVEEPLLRYRIVLVSGGILMWVGSGLAARVGGGEFMSFVTLTVFGLFASASVLLAYHPPPWVRTRLARDRSVARLPSP